MAKNSKSNNAWLWLAILAVVILTAIILYSYNLGTISSEPFGSFCIAQSGFICKFPVLHNNVFMITLGQATGTNWANVNFLWVPQGQSPPPTSAFCPAINSTTINETSCATPNNINLESGLNKTENFTFKPENYTSGNLATMGKIYSGTIWAEYQTNLGGTWYAVQVATAKLKSV